MTYKGAHGQGTISPDLYDLEAVAAMRGLGVSQVEVTVSTLLERPAATQSMQHVLMQKKKTIPSFKTERPNELPTVLFNDLVRLLEKEFPTARWYKGSLASDAVPILEAMAAVLSFLQGSAGQLAKRSARLPATLLPLTEVKMPGISGSHRKTIVVAHIVDDPMEPQDPLNAVPSQVRERFHKAYCKLLQCFI